MMAWTWKDGVATLATIHQSPGELNLTAGYDTSLVQVPRIEATSTYKTLGAFVSPSGNVTEAVHRLKTQSLDYSTHVTGSHFSREDALWSYISYYIPQVGYSIPVLSLSEKECQTIQSPAVQAILPKMHINRNTSRAIVFGPTAYGGLGLPHLYPHSNFKKLTLFLGHLRLQDKTGKLIMIGLSHIQLIVGSGVLFLNQQYDKFGKEVPGGWLSSVWEFSSQISLTYQIVDHWIPHPQRQGDTFIMTLFRTLSLPSSTITILNRCRLYLQVITVADIASADGKLIVPWVKDGLRHRDRFSTLHWPNQAGHH
jgi:hypothetical protein